MKLTIDIDCTPEEARAFFGLPDLGKARQVKGWLPGGVRSLEEYEATEPRAGEPGAGEPKI